MPKYRKPLPAELPEPEIIDLEALAADLRSGAVELVCVLGPTASGKTKYAVRLARELAGLGLDAEIISADSRQVYRGMDIGTGKDLAEYEEIPYHLIDIREAGTQYNVYDFVQDFRLAFADIRSRGRVAILCGGTGLYINAVTAGYDFRSSKPLSQPADSGRLSVAGSGGGHSATATHGPAQKTSAAGNAGPESVGWEQLGESDILKAGHQLGEAELLFAKIEDDAIQKQLDRLAAIRAEKEAEAKAALAKQVTPQKAECSFDDFEKMDIRTATVLEAERVPKTDKLLKLTIDTGIDKRVIVSGIAEYYSPEDMIGKQICILANLQPRTIRGIESKGMILMAKQNDGKMRFITPQEAVVNGAQIG